MKVLFVTLVLLALCGAAFASKCGTVTQLDAKTGNVEANEDFFGSSIFLCFAGSAGEFTGVVTNIGFITGSYNGVELTGTVQFGGITYSNSNQTFTANSATFTMALVASPCYGDEIGGTITVNGEAHEWIWSQVKGDSYKQSCATNDFVSLSNIVGHYENRLVEEDGTYTVTTTADICLYDSRNHPNQVRGSISTAHPGHTYYLEGVLSADGATITANIWRGDDASGNIVKNSYVYAGYILLYQTSEETVEGVFTEYPFDNEKRTQNSISLTRWIDSNGNYPGSKSSRCTANKDLKSFEFSPETYPYKFNSIKLNQASYNAFGYPA